MDQISSAKITMSRPTAKIIFVDEPVKRGRGRPKKFFTDEQRKEAFREYERKKRAINRENKKRLKELEAVVSKIGGIIKT